MQLVKLIIVNYNSKKWIESCLNSIKHANLIDKTIIIDNGSQDESIVLIEQTYPQVELIKLGKNIGFGQANNVGIRKAYDAGADFVFLMNQDVYIKPDTIEKLIELSNNHPEFGVLSPMHLNGDGTALDYNFSKLKPIHFGIYKLKRYLADMSYSYLNYGISTEDSGRYVNESLLSFKESFNGQGIIRTYWKKELM